MTGVVIYTYDVRIHDGPFNHIYYGGKTVDTRWCGGLKSQHVTMTDGNLMNIRTKDSKWNGSWKPAFLPGDNNDNWGNDHWAATSCHWGVSQAWLFWQNKWEGINGIDDNGRPISVFADFIDGSAEFNNSAFETGLEESGSDHILIGRAISSGSLMADLDVLTHEYTHGVIKNRVDFLRGFDQEALNESYCDIFGFLSDREQFGFSNWIYGDNSNLVGQRDLSWPKNITPNPSACLPTEFPTYYQQDTGWYFGSDINCDMGGAHHNSQVQNYCFYLLSTGGTQLGITVTGIGIDKAADIAHYALMHGMVTRITNYPENREAWVAAAIILFGECSPEHIQTCKAWAAVNIGAPCPCVPPPYVLCWPDRWRNLAGISQNLDVNEFAIYSKDITLFPNPAKDELNVSFSGLNSNYKHQDRRISIIDISGCVVKSVFSDGRFETESIDIELFCPGTYFVEIIINTGIYSRRFIKI